MRLNNEHSLALLGGASHLEIAMKFTNNSGQTKAVKVSGGHEILRPNESKNIKGDFDPDYIDYLERQGVTVAGSKKKTTKPKKAEKAPEKTQEATDEVTESDDDAPVVVTDEITSENAEVAQGASE